MTDVICVQGFHLVVVINFQDLLQEFACEAVLWTLLGFLARLEQ